MPEDCLFQACLRHCDGRQYLHIETPHHSIYQCMANCGRKLAALQSDQP
jgi:hypothetical protein